MPDTLRRCWSGEERYSSWRAKAFPSDYSRGSNTTRILSAWSREIYSSGLLTLLRKLQTQTGKNSEINGLGNCFCATLEDLLMRSRMRSALQSRRGPEAWSVTTTQRCCWQGACEPPVGAVYDRPLFLESTEDGRS